MTILNSAPGGNSIDFEPGLKPKDIKVESPAEHAMRMEELSKRFDLPKQEDVKSESSTEEPKKLISSYEATLNRFNVEPKDESPVVGGVVDVVKIEEPVTTPEVPKNEEVIEQSEASIENFKKVESVSSFDELFEVMDSFNDYIPMKSGGFVSSTFTKSLINKYRSGETPIYVKDMLDSLKNHSDGSDSLKGITSNFGLRKKVYELLRAEGTVNYVTLKGEIKHAGEKSKSVEAGAGLVSQDVVLDGGIELSQLESNVDSVGGIVENAESGYTGDIVNDLTNEQKITQHERDLSSKYMGSNIEFHASIQNIILDLIKEKGLGIKKENIDKILTLVPQRDGITIVTTEGSLTFLKSFTGDRVIYVNDIHEGKTEKGSIEINSEGQRELYGEEADSLWEDYKPEIILELYDEAETIYNKGKETERISGIDGSFENETDDQFSERFKSYILDRNTKKARGEAVESDEEFKTKMNNVNRQRLALKMKKGFAETN